MTETSHRDLPLFAYGTLMFPAVVKSVIGRVPDCCQAAIEGYRRLEVAGESFPGLIREQGERIEGLLYFDLREDEWKSLRAFEDDFYQLEEVTVSDARATLQALAYIVPPTHKSLLSEKTWDPEFFRRHHLVQFSRRSSNDGPQGV